MTDKEKAIRWFENIANGCDKLTSGNVAHLKAQIKGMAIRSAEYLTKHSQEHASEELEQAATDYAERNKCEWETCSGNWDDSEELEDAVKFGANWQKEQMMKDAVEGQIEGDQRNQEDEPYDVYAVSDSLDTTKFKIGDKVKVIIVKGND